MRQLLAEDIAHVLTHAAPALQVMRGWRVLITGGTGFFGRWLIECLLAYNEQEGAGIDLVVLSRDPERFLSEMPHLSGRDHLRWVQGQILELSREFLEKSGGVPTKFDAVMHLVTESDGAKVRRDPLQAIQVISGGTQAALQCARECGVRRFLFTSSGSVYGPAPAGLSAFDETYVGAPSTTDVTSTYGLAGSAKRHAELLCAAAACSTSVETIIARCFAFYGPHLPLDGKFAFGNFVRDSLAEKSIVISGDGTPVRTYLYAADLTVWLLHLLVRGKSGEAYNVGSENEISIRTLAERVRTAARVEGSISVLRSPDSSGRIDRYVPSTARARQELGLGERIEFDTGLARTLDWYRTAGRFA